MGFPKKWGMEIPKFRMPRVSYRAITIAPEDMTEKPQSKVLVISANTSTNNVEYNVILAGTQTAKRCLVRLDKPDQKL